MGFDPAGRAGDAQAFGERLPREGHGAAGPGAWAEARRQGGLETRGRHGPLRTLEERRPLLHLWRGGQRLVWLGAESEWQVGRPHPGLLPPGRALGLPLPPSSVPACRALASEKVSHTLVLFLINLKRETSFVFQLRGILFYIFMGFGFGFNLVCGD